MWRTLLVGCALLALADSLRAQGRDPFPPRRAAAKAPAAKPTPTPAPVVKRAPAPVVKRAPTPVAKRAPERTKPTAPSVAAATPAPAPQSVAAGPSPKAGTVPRESDGRRVVVEPSTVRRFLTAWQPRLAASEEYVAIFRERLKTGREENAKIAADLTLTALASDQNRKLGPLLTAGGDQAHGRRDWLAQLRAANAAPAPLSVEQTLRKAETVAFRTQTFSGETKSLIGKASGTALWTDVSAGGGLLVPNLRTIPGAIHDSPVTHPYAVQNLDLLRAAIEGKKSALTEQFRSARHDWQQWNSRGEELHRRYTELRVTPSAE